MHFAALQKALDIKALRPRIAIAAAHKAPKKLPDRLLNT
jgi:hypothetical protein